MSTVTHPKPRECRLTVFATTYTYKGKGRKYQAIPQRIAWQEWNDSPFQERRHGRLQGAGSFYWPGVRAAYRKAVVLFRQDHTIEAIRIEGIGAQPVAYLRRTDVGPRYGDHPEQPSLIARF